MCELPYETALIPYYDLLSDWERRVTDLYIKKFPQLKNEIESNNLYMWGVEQNRDIKKSLLERYEEIKNIISECKTPKELKRKFRRWRDSLPVDVETFR